MSDEITLRLVITAVSLLAYKITILLVGTLFAVMGYMLLKKGITGGFKFSAEYKGVKADIISASPGIFFILAGTIIISIAIYKGLILETSPNSESKQFSSIEDSLKVSPPEMNLPKIPPSQTNVTKKGD